ncbi:MAG: zf-HC2 domain-containing protein [Terracidiphilus sp.]
MAERTHIPSSPACGLWETLLADALDGLLTPDDEATFTSHMAACPACTALFEESRRGREWLEFLSPEPEVPAGLVDRILAHTGPGHSSGFELAAQGNVLAMPQIPAWQRPGFLGHVRRFAEPRLMMTAAMAFFSIALTLNMTGVRLSTLRLSDLRPTAVRSFMERQFTMASVPIIRYYDHLRFVYEVESRMRELRSSQTEGEGQSEQDSRPAGAQPSPGESRQDLPGGNPSLKNAPRKDGGSRMEPPQQSGNPAGWPPLDDSGDILETSLTFQHWPAHSGGSALAIRERSMIWIA